MYKKITIWINTRYSNNSQFGERRITSGYPGLTFTFTQTHTLSHAQRTVYTHQKII